MEETWLLFFLSASSFLLLHLLSKHYFQSSPKRKNLPPSPPSLPIIGHLHFVMKQPIHTSLQNLSKKYGPVLNLQFGNRKVLLISSPSAVEDCLSKNDTIFANRPRLLVGKYLNYDSTTIGTAPYGEHWRSLRRLTALEIFSTKPLNTFLGIRQDEVRRLVRNLYQSTIDKSLTKVDVKSKLSELSFNIIMRMVAGKRYFGQEAENSEAKHFREIISEIFALSGASNPGDYLPILRWLDYQSYEKKLMRLKKKSDRFLQSLIDEHRNKRVSSGTQNTRTIIDSMLVLHESKPDNYSDEIIKGVILNLLTAGTDTSTVTIEWAMSLLLNHPAVLDKARAEIDGCVGHGRLVEEHDVRNLHFIQSIINETLRLYPAGPLLVPHESLDDCNVCGFHVPKSTILIVNALALHRDPDVWEDPMSFKPERFEGESGTEGNSSNTSYKFIPFGLGRRACPGAGLANRVMALALAALIQCFEWERVGEEEVDMTEGTGLTMPKAKPLEAMCKAREAMVDVISEL